MSFFSALRSEAFASDIVLEFRLRLQTPSLSCLRACSFDRFPRGSRSPGSDGCSPLRASRSLAPPKSAATPNSKDIYWGEETRRFYLIRSWIFVSLLF